MAGPAPFNSMEKELVGRGAEPGEGTTGTAIQLFEGVAGDRVEPHLGANVVPGIAVVQGVTDPLGNGGSGSTSSSTNGTTDPSCSKTTCVHVVVVVVMHIAIAPRTRGRGAGWHGTKTRSKLVPITVWSTKVGILLLGKFYSGVLGTGKTVDATTRSTGTETSGDGTTSTGTVATDTKSISAFAVASVGGEYKANIGNTANTTSTTTTSARSSGTIGTSGSAVTLEKVTSDVAVFIAVSRNTSNSGGMPPVAVADLKEVVLQFLEVGLDTWGVVEDMDKRNRVNTG
eukprot:TRINITY_DN3143_c0_g2_i1.p1 TRINITY_DN3143_c0_g2~~TRINITY_DN3143_c0_g2_i1.p1  ORF type:complete len:286 (-),score=38.18 TRINITY_DN3143_c0_g2_i1:134-991(-)